MRFHKKHLLAVFILLFSYVTVAENDNDINAEYPELDKLEGQFYRVTTVNEVRKVKLITGYEGNPWEQDWWSSGDGKKCKENLAKLSTRDAAVGIKGKPLIIAFLDCPAANDTPAPGVLIALFNKNDLNSPVCTNYVDLFDKRGYYYWGGVSSIAISKAKDNGYFVAMTGTGGDGGAAWTSLQFLHFDLSCKTTILHKRYVSSYLDDMNPAKCTGHKIDFSYLNDWELEIEQKPFVCGKHNKDMAKPTKEKIDLMTALKNPSLRTIKP